MVYWQQYGYRGMKNANLLIEDDMLIGDGTKRAL